MFALAVNDLGLKRQGIKRMLGVLHFNHFICLPCFASCPGMLLKKDCKNCGVSKSDIYLHNPIAVATFLTL